MGENNINKLSFFQKVEIAKNNLSAQGKDKPTTADIVNEMVRMTKAEKADSTTLPEGYNLEHTAQSRGFDDSLVLYGTPNINNSLFMISSILSRLTTDSNLSNETKQEVLSILKDMVKLLASGKNIPPEIMELLEQLSTDVAKIPTELLYDTPDINIPDAYSLSVKFITEFVSNDKISDKVKQQLQNLIKEESSKATNSLPEQIIFNAISRLIREYHPNEETKNEIINILKSILTPKADVYIDKGGYCVYDTPDIRTNKLKLVMDIIEKIQEPDSTIPDDLKLELMHLLKQIIIELIEADNPVPQEILKAIEEFFKSVDIKDATTGKKIEGTQKMLVKSEEDFFAKYPADKYEIVHKMSMGHNMVMIFFREKQ